MSTFQITAVRVETTPFDRHEHITHVRIGNATFPIGRETVVRDLRDPNGDRYYTYASGQYATVYVRTCPHCSFRDYITTYPDTTPLNNLLSLPRF